LAFLKEKSIKKIKIIAFKKEFKAVFTKFGNRD
jgi:hypothetical protein